MSQTVVLKSNKYGINLLLDDKVSFEQLILDIKNTFKEADSFFKDAKMALSFEGRKLTEEEELKIVEVISQNSSLSVLCIIENDPEKEEMIKNLIEPQKEKANISSGSFYGSYTSDSSDTSDVLDASDIGQFYKGTLRSGQLLESETSIVIVGDVNPGAKIISLGNIVVLGSLKGNAYAGVGGDASAFVAALEMAPVQIRIGDVIARSEDAPMWTGKTKNKSKLKNKNKVEVAVTPQVALVKNGNIYIEPITKGLLNNL